MADFTMFTDYEVFRGLFGTGFAGSILQKAGRVIENLTQDELVELIHQQSGKWPHNLDRDIMISAIKRAVQTKFYKELYGKDPSLDVLARDIIFMERLALGNTPPDTTVKLKSKAIGQTIVIPPVQPVVGLVQIKKPIPPKQQIRPAKEKKPESAFSAKIKGMNLEDIIAWAKKVGVTGEKIDQHKAKPIGLAKMNISNLIRGKLPKNDPILLPKQVLGPTQVECRS